MVNQSKQFNTIDEYIKSFPQEDRLILTQFRHAIQTAAPDAAEAIKYQMPTFVLFGNLVHFAGYKHHIGFYPTPSGIEAFKKELSGFVTSKGAIQFPMRKQVPFNLVKKIVEFRVKENLKKEKDRINQL